MVKNRTESHKKHKQELLKIIAVAARNEKLLDLFLGDLLTPSEFKELTLRWQIVQQLTEGVPQRTIADNLKVGIATVTRGSRELSKNGGFTKFLDKKYKKGDV